MAEDRKRLDDDFEDVGVWVQTKSSELLNADQHLEPLKAKDFFCLTDRPFNFN